MPRRNVLRHRTTVLCLSIIGLVFVGSARTGSVPAAASQNTSFGYCMSDQGGRTVYFSAVFDAKGIATTLPAGSEFAEYLKGRYDYTSNSNFSAECPVSWYTAVQAEEARRAFEAKVRQSQKEVVEVEWRYTPDETLVAASRSLPQHSANMRVTSEPTHTFCLSDAYQGSVYSAGPVDTVGNTNLSLWSGGFMQYLKAKYSYQGRMYCNFATLSDARRLMNARFEGARAAGRRVVETGWKYDATFAPSNDHGASAQDDDREPPRQTAQPQSAQAQAHAAANKEGQEAYAICRNDAVMNGTYDCQCVASLVHDYSVKQAKGGGQTEPVASLLAGDKINGSKCMGDWKVKIWARSYALRQLRGKPQTVADCVVEQYVTSLHSKPYPGQASRLFDEAIQACNK